MAQSLAFSPFETKTPPALLSNSIAQHTSLQNMGHTTNCIKALFSVEPPSHDPKIARLKSHIERLEKEMKAKNETVNTVH